MGILSGINVIESNCISRDTVCMTDMSHYIAVTTNNIENGIGRRPSGWDIKQNDIMEWLQACHLLSYLLQDGKILKI